MGNTYSVVMSDNIPQGWIVIDWKEDENSVMFCGRAKLFLLAFIFRDVGLKLIIFLYLLPISLLIHYEWT